MPIEVALYRREIPVFLTSENGDLRLAVLREMNSAIHSAHLTECYDVKRMAKAVNAAESTHKTDAETNADPAFQEAVMPLNPAQAAFDRLSRSLFLEVNPTEQEKLIAVREEAKALPGKECDAVLLKFYHAAIHAIETGQGERPIAMTEMECLPYNTVHALIDGLRGWEKSVRDAAKNP